VLLRNFKPLSGVSHSVVLYIIVVVLGRVLILLALPLYLLLYVPAPLFKLCILSSRNLNLANTLFKADTPGTHFTFLSLG
jgi:hypothetical protein